MYSITSPAFVSSPIQYAILSSTTSSFDEYARSSRQHWCAVARREGDNESFTMVEVDPPSIGLRQYHKHQKLQNFKISLALLISRCTVVYSVSSSSSLPPLSLPKRLRFVTRQTEITVLVSCHWQIWLKWHFYCETVEPRNNNYNSLYE